jgi:trafficking protein particle complex subunit 9
MTVYHMLECYDMNIISYSNVGGMAKDKDTDSSYESDDTDDWCLFSVEVRNTYGLPFEVTFERTEGGKASYMLQCSTGLQLI